MILKTFALCSHLIMSALNSISSLSPAVTHQFREGKPLKWGTSCTHGGTPNKLEPRLGAGCSLLQILCTHVNPWVGGTSATNRCSTTNYDLHSLCYSCVLCILLIPSQGYSFWRWHAEKYNMEFCCMRCLQVL